MTVLSRGLSTCQTRFSSRLLIGGDSVNTIQTIKWAMRNKEHWHWNIWSSGKPICLILQNNFSNFSIFRVFRELNLVVDALAKEAANNIRITETVSLTREFLRVPSFLYKLNPKAHLLLDNQNSTR